MLKSASKEFESALAARSVTAKAIILAGDNAELKNDLFRSVLRAHDVDRNDVFRLVSLDSETLDADTGRLADELAAIPMFGGLKIVRATPSPRQFGDVLSCAMNAPAGEWLLVIEIVEFESSIALPSGSDDTRVLVVDCVADRPGDFRSLVAREFDRAGIQVDDGVIETLIELLGEDRSAARGEIEKISLYLHGSQQPTESMIRDVIADASALASDQLTNAILSGETVKTAALIDRLEISGSDAVQALSALLQRVLWVFRARAKQWSVRNDSPDSLLSIGDCRALSRHLQASVRQVRVDGSTAPLNAEHALIVLGNALSKRRRRA